MTMGSQEIVCVLQKPFGFFLVFVVGMFYRMVQLTPVRRWAWVVPRLLSVSMPPEKLPCRVPR